MTRPNALLVSWQGGWFWRDLVDEIAASGLRIEERFDAGNARTVSAAQREADAQLSAYALGQTEISVAVDPSGDGDVPGLDYRIGDSVTVDGAQRRTVGTAGRWSSGTRRKAYEPTFGQMIEDPDRRTMRTLQKMVPGSGGGTFRQASPVVAPPRPDVMRAPHMGFDPSWETGYYENFGTGINLLQFGLDDLHPAQPAGYLLPPGDIGDELFVFLMLSENVAGGLITEANIDVTQHDDVTGAQIGTLAVSTYELHYDSPGVADGVLVVAHGARAFGTEDGQIQFLFTGSSGSTVPEVAGWIFGNFPAGTYTEVAAETWWDGTGGSESDSGSLSAPGSGLFVGGVTSFWSSDPDDPHVSPSVAVDARTDGNFYAFRAFALSASSPLFGFTMTNPTDSLVHAVVYRGTM